MVGETFGNYEVVATLGKGGMGVVFLAQHRSIARRAAIKVLASELTKDPGVVRRFFLEARATSLIRHPGIVDVFDFDVEESGRAYIVMEYLEGETLAACLERARALPWQTACAVGSRIASAVAAAHSHGIVHRDLKPANVFLSRVDPPTAATERRIKILDFGLAKLLSDEAPGEPITRTGMLLGTPAYISPEQCTPSGRVTCATDVYTLGCILFEMISGQLPFDGQALRALLAAHVFAPPPRVAARVPAVPPWLDDLIARMLAKDPANRPASMAEIAAALSQGQSEEAGSTLMIPPEWESARIAPVATMHLPISEKGVTGGAGSRLRQRRIRFATVIAGLAAIAVLGGLALSRRAPRVDADTDAEAPIPASAVAVEARAPSAIGSRVPVSAQVMSNTTLAAPATSAPDAQSPRSIGPTESRAPVRRRAVEPPARRRVESPRAPAPKEADGIVDL